MAGVAGETRPGPEARSPGKRRAAGIYGAIITAAILATAGSELHTSALVVTVVVTLVVYWLAEEYAELIGEQVELRVGDPVARCAAITRDPDRGARDQQLVRLIRDYRGMCELPRGPGVPFGVYAHVLRPGRLATGEMLTLADDHA